MRRRSDHTPTSHKVVWFSRGPAHPLSGRITCQDSQRDHMFLASRAKCVDPHENERKAFSGAGIFVRHISPATISAGRFDRRIGAASATSHSSQAGLVPCCTLSWFPGQGCLTPSTGKSRLECSARRYCDDRYKDPAANMVPSLVCGFGHSLNACGFKQMRVESYREFGRTGSSCS